VNRLVDVEPSSYLPPVRLAALAVLLFVPQLRRQTRHANILAQSFDGRQPQHLVDQRHVDAGRLDLVRFALRLPLAHRDEPDDLV
jgi:hypothetical protein